MQRAQVDDVSLEYADSGSGEPIVFIHGAFVADTFQPLLTEPALVGHYRLVTWHRRGYAGSTSSAGPVPIGRQAADCRGLLRHLGIERAHVVGHSLGGCVALQLALDAPDVIQSLTLLEAALFVGESADLYRAGQLRSLARYREAGAEVAIDEALGARCPDYRAILAREIPGAFEQAVADATTVYELDVGQLDWQFGEPDARRIAQPALVVLGGESAGLHPRFSETYRLLLSWLPRAEGFILPGATHFLQLENPSGMAAALAAFAARHPIDPASGPHDTVGASS